MLPWSVYPYIRARSGGGLIKFTQDRADGWRTWVHDNPSPVNLAARYFPPARSARQANTATAPCGNPAIAPYMGIRCGAVSP
ncbi:hypothetical protein HKCCA1065_09115 [Rhodobacterales bacterium HKCCA1065]|nr:hypothetical protein [Rhodobacterales bacterium HKCCA1065]